MEGSGCGKASHPISVLYTNIRSIMKPDAFEGHIGSCEADMIAVIETRLNSNVSDSEILTISQSLQIYRCDQDERQGGGTLLAISKCFKSFLINLTSTLEAIWCGVVANNKTHVFDVCYRPRIRTLALFMNFTITLMQL